MTFDLTGRLQRRYQSRREQQSSVRDEVGLQTTLAPPLSLTRFAAQILQIDLSLELSGEGPTETSDHKDAWH